MMLTLGNYSLLNRCACLLATSCETICNPIHFLHRLVPKNIRREKTNKPNYSLLYCTPQTFKAFGFNLVLSMSQDNCHMFLLDTLMKSCTDLFFSNYKKKKGKRNQKEIHLWKSRNWHKNERITRHFFGQQRKVAHAYSHSMYCERSLWWPLA